jgi:hypothetical protein
MNVVHRELRVPAPVHVKDQGPQAEFAYGQVQHVGTVYPSAQSQYAVKVSTLPILSNPRGFLFKRRSSRRPGRPKGLDVAVEVNRMITDAARIERDSGITRVHDGARADLVSPVHLRYSSGW